MSNIVDNSNNDKPKTVSSNYILIFAGSISGGIEALSVQPFDMIKTRQQLNTINNETVLQTMRKIYQEGGIKRFYRGMSAEIIGIMPKSSAMYASYEIIFRKLESMENFGNTSFSASIAGFFASFPEAFVVTPTQVVKVRLQAKEHLGRYKGSLDCLMQIIRREGILGLTTGLEPTLWRNCIWNMVYFGTMHKLKTLLPSPTSKNMDLGMTFFSGFFGAVFATCFNAPFDVVKSRFQSQIVIPGQKLKYNYAIPSLITIYKEEGFLSCYKGFKPKAIRMGLGGGIAMFTFEAIQHLFSVNT